MVSLEQLRQLREMVHGAVSRLRMLEEENAALRAQLEKYEGDLEGLNREKEELSKTQSLMGAELGQILEELQNIEAANIDESSSSLKEGFDYSDQSETPSSMSSLFAGQPAEVQHEQHVQIVAPEHNPLRGPFTEHAVRVSPQAVEEGSDTLIEPAPTVLGEAKGQPAGQVAKSSQLPRAGKDMGESIESELNNLLSNSSEETQLADEALMTQDYEAEILDSLELSLGSGEGILDLDLDSSSTTLSMPDDEIDIF